ncbi:BA75_02923T1 [Komagataella pastoris]|uniref:BA75_02923T1 n=1 Tax=Komagataella pastoris TaxID=4922 RepID=A0A1B2JBQ7_PICPA|nr:BA75_02923T1 [Komagataella pastoris]
MTKFTILLSVLLRLSSAFAQVPKTTERFGHTIPRTSTLEAIGAINPAGLERTVTAEAPYEYRLIGNDHFNPGSNAKREIIDCEAVCCEVIPTSVPLRKREECECDNVCCPGATDCETYVTTTQPWTGTYETTYTVPPSGTEPGTVVIETPEVTDCEAVCCGAIPTSVPLRKREECECDNVCCPGATDCETYVTTTQPWTGTYETTYTVPPSGTEPGTVVIETPESYVTTTQPWTGTYETTFTVPPSGTEPGTVVIETPEVTDCEAVCCGPFLTSVPLRKREVCDCDNVCCPGATDCETYVTTTQPWTGTYETTFTVPPSGTEPGTVVIETPESYVTTTQPWTGTYETTYTVPPSGTEPGTVVIETPEIIDCEAVCCEVIPISVSLRKREECNCDNICCPWDTDCETYVTTTQPWTGTYETTFTVPPSGTEPGTVVIETPESYVTTTQPWTGTYETTFTVPPSGTEPGTVVIETPEIIDCEAVCCRPFLTSVPLRKREECDCDNICCPWATDCETYVTTTQPWTGTYETTFTVPPSGTEPGTVVIETPESYVTTTQPWTGTYETTFTVPPSGTEPGTVVIETPESYVTTTQPWTGTYETTYTVPPSGTEPGTVVIETPESYVTTTQPWTGTYETTFTVPPSGTEPGTVVIETPESYVTTTQPWTGTYETTFTVPPSGTEPGTVVIETPESYVTTTQPWTGTYETTYTVPPSGTEPGTVVIETPESYVTTTQPWTGTYETTHTVPPSGTEPGTVIVETPIGYLNTSVSASTRTWTKTDTVTQFISCPVCTIPKTITVTPKLPNETVTVIISQPHSTSSKDTATTVKTQGASVSSHSHKTTVKTYVKPEHGTSKPDTVTTTVVGSHSAKRTSTGSLSGYQASSIPHTVTSQEKASSTVTHTESSTSVYQVSPSNGASWLSVRLNTVLSVIGTLFAAVLI